MAYGFWKTSKRGDFRVSAFLFPRLTAISWCGRQSALVRSIIWAKPIQGELLLERIHQMLKQETPTKEAAKSKAAERRENPFEELESEISILLSRMGISASIKGYHFIRKAVMMAVENQDVLVGITKGLYPDIAKQYKTTASKVERAIRHAIESVWKKNGPQIYFEIAGYLPTEKPTNGQFIAALSEYFRIKEKGKSKKIS